MLMKNIAYTGFSSSKIRVLLSWILHHGIHGSLWAHISRIWKLKKEWIWASCILFPVVQDSYIWLRMPSRIPFSYKPCLWRPAPQLFCGPSVWEKWWLPYWPTALFFSWTLLNYLLLNFSYSQLDSAFGVKTQADEYIFLSGIPTQDVLKHTSAGKSLNGFNKIKMHDTFQQSRSLSTQGKVD